MSNDSLDVSLPLLLVLGFFIILPIFGLSVEVVVRIPLRSEKLHQLKPESSIKGNQRSVTALLELTVFISITSRINKANNTHFQKALLERSLKIVFYRRVISTKYSENRS